jgi:hypothetical protein
MMFFFFSFSSNHTSDLLGLSTPPSQQQNSQSTLIDVLGDIYNQSSSGGVNNAKK